MHSKPIAALAKRIDFLTEQPHPIWANLRSEAPVVRVETNEGERPVCYVSGWREADTVLRDPDTFSSSINAESVGQVMGPMMLSMDGEQHRGHRLLVSQAFRASQLARWERTLIHPRIAGLLDTIAGAGRAELIGEVVSKFPVLVICGMCDVPPEDSPRFLQWALDIHRAGHDADAGMAAAAEMRAYLEPLVEARRIKPGNDLISDIVNAEIEGKRLDDEEIYGFLRLLLPAGSESTFRAMASAIYAVLTVPGLKDRVMADRSLLPPIIEETIRWEVSNTMVTRLATRDTELGGCFIAAGTQVFVFTSSANRDSAHFAEADRFDANRTIIRHLGFGTGPHQCLGMHLARIELRVGLDAVFDRLPNLRLDPDFPEPVVQGFSFRGPNALRVRFDHS